MTHEQKLQKALDIATTQLIEFTKAPYHKDGNWEAIVVSWMQKSAIAMGKVKACFEQDAQSPHS